MPGKRDTTSPLGFGLVGTWIQLEPYSPATAPEFADLDARREMNHLMGAGSQSHSSQIAPRMLVRVRSTGEAVGVVENHAVPGKVAAFVVYMDRAHSRRGFGLESAVLYISHLFDSGARLVSAEVLEFNTEMVSLFRRINVAPQARLREHVYVAGHFWDLLIYSFDRAQWVEIIGKYRRKLPGGDRRPAAIGGKPLPG